MEERINSVRVVIPAYNSEATILRCLDAVYASAYKNFEVVVVDDASNDRTAEIARRYPARLVKCGNNRGAAHARNLGSSDCTSDYILFVDSDVMIGRDTVIRLIGRAVSSGLDAVIGCYTTLPVSRSWFSVYHNLFQYFYFFRNSALRSGRAGTSVFWTGCGLVSTRAFLDVGGFYEGIAGASTEDDIFGYELTKKGHCIYIDMDITVSHDHRYSFSQLLGNYFKRAFKLAETMFISRPEKIANQGYFNVLNAGALLFSYLFIAASIAAVIKGSIFCVISAAVFLMFLLINLNFYIFIMRLTSLPFTIFSVVINFLCYFVTGIGAAAGVLESLVPKLLTGKGPVIAER